MFRYAVAEYSSLQKIQNGVETEDVFKGRHQARYNSLKLYWF